MGDTVASYQRGQGHTPGDQELQFEMFPIERPTTEQIVAAALAHEPVKIYAMLSGGDGSLSASTWAMRNVPGCEILHINTGIGIPPANQFVRDICAEQGWRLTEIRAKEDCGQDYEEIVLKHGFPGPAAHNLMYRQLKERCVEEAVRRVKTKKSDKVMLLTGICHDDSQRRSGYGGREITFKGAQMWVNHMYWAGSTWVYHYQRQSGIRRNPVAEALGMSGECLCGAYAGVGELAIVRRVHAPTAERIERLQVQAKAAGVHWKWEERPPKERDDNLTADMFSPMCTNCLKSPARIAA